MDSLLNRYRNITVLLLVIFAQLILLAYQVKGNQDVRLIRVWAVSVITPLARVVEAVRGGTVGVLEDYIVLRNQGEENRRLKEELGRLKMENQYLKSELSTADRARALSVFQEHTASRTLAARIIGTATGSGSRVVYVDRGSVAGVMRGMAVVTPDGIVGKIIAAYPTASQLLLITDPSFAAGVISQKHRVHGTLKGQGHNVCLVDYVPNEEKVDPGELFFTSGDDGVFPKGFLAGKVTTIRPGRDFKQIFLAPSGLQSGLEEVLIVVEGVHQPIPEAQKPSTDVHLTPPPPPAAEPAGDENKAPSAQTLPRGTEADRLLEKYKEIGEAQGHTFGAGTLGTKPPNFNVKVTPGGAVRPPGAAAGNPGAPPAAAAKPGAPPAARATPPRAPAAKPTPQPGAGVPRIP